MQRKNHFGHSAKCKLHLNAFSEPKRHVFKRNLNFVQRSCSNHNYTNLGIPIMEFRLLAKRLMCFFTVQITEMAFRLNIPSGKCHTTINFAWKVTHKWFNDKNVNWSPSHWTSSWYVYKMIKSLRTNLEKSCWQDKLLITASSSKLDNCKRLNTPRAYGGKREKHMTFAMQNPDS